MNLVALIAIPLAGGLLAIAAGRVSVVAPRWIAVVSMLAALGLVGWLWASHDFSYAAGTGSASWTIEMRADWIPSIGASFHLGLDGLSLVLIALTNALGLAAVGVAWRSVEQRPGFFYLNLLWNVGAVAGVFLALDLLLFFFFWEMMLVPMYFLIALWGTDVAGKTRIDAAVKYVVFTQASGLLLLVSIVGLAMAHRAATGVITFDYTDLLGTPLAPRVEWWLMVGFFVAFAVKIPLVPLHGWLPDAHTHAPDSGAVDLAGLLVKTGAYGLLRFALPLFPHASLDITPLAMLLGVLGVVYGAAVAFAQTDMKRLIAYTGISHMGFVVIGTYASTPQALTGVVVQLVAHGLSAGALFVLVGAMQARLGTRDLRELGGLWSALPNLPRLVLFFALATLGLPGLGNFVGEFLILSGTFTIAPMIAIAASSGLILAVVYALAMVQRALHGPPRGVAARPGLRDLAPRELAIALALVVALLALGLYPQPVIDVARAPVDALAALAVDAATDALAAPGGPP